MKKFRIVLFEKNDFSYIYGMCSAVFVAVDAVGAGHLRTCDHISWEFTGIRMISANETLKTLLSGNKFPSFENLLVPLSRTELSKFFHL